MKYLIAASFFLFLIASNSYAQVNLNNGLVAFLPFNGNANDASVNGNNGLPQNGIQLTTDRFGNPNSAYLLDGLDDYISLTDPAGHFTTVPFSTVIWFQTQSTNFQAVIGKRDFGSNNGQQYQVSIFRPAGAGVFSSVTYNTIPCSGSLTNDVLSMTNYPDPYCLDKWHCIIVTYDGSLHKMFFDGKLVSQNIPAFNSILQCNSDIRLGNWWSGDPLWFKGKLDDFRWYNRNLTDDEIALLSQQDNTTGIDFTFTQDLCNPLLLNFRNYTSTATSYNWNFSDQNVQSSIANPSHTFSAPGNYTVRLITNGNTSCPDTISKRIDIRQLAANLISNPDTIICSGDSLKIRPVTANDFCLSTAQGIISTGTSGPFVKPQIRTTYTMQGVISNPNMVANGSFENGNTGFTSEYLFAPTRNADGQFGIVPNASQWYPGLNCINCRDHTNPPTGNMLVSDGSVIANRKIWNSNILVSTNTTYRISFWAIAYDAIETAQLALFINNRKSGEWSSTSSEIGSWKQFSTLWNSGSEGILNLDIRNLNITAINNRFSIDDISVTVHQSAIDSFTVDIRPALSIIASTDTAICPGTSTRLSVTGATSYVWTPIQGLSDPAIANPVASPTVTTKYFVRSANINSCVAIDSVLITVNPAQALLVSGDTSICNGGFAQLLVSGGISYQWAPATGLSASSIPNPVASPVLSTLYTVTSTDLNGCTASDSVTVTVNPAGAIISASSDTITCLGTPVQLNANGASNYKWTPAYRSF